tara:strand:+ start:3347 stop:3940 length:594 start_codon:yes stop_codon:yes gene_type:complete
LRTLISTLLFFINICFSSFYINLSKPLVNLNYHLAISINPGSNSDYVNYAIVGEKDGKLVYTKFITCHEFILIGMGKQWSAANDIGINIFKKFNIKDCMYKYDSVDCKKKPEPKIFDLWSLRYNRNPFCPPDCIPAENMLIEGYGQHRARPSWPQLQILQKYGIIYINDFFYGEKLFQLLADFQKPEWRQNYEDAIE